MKKIFALLLLIPLCSHAQISDAICGTWDAVMKGQTVGFREMGLPIGTAEDTFNSEDDLRTRVFETEAKKRGIDTWQKTNTTSASNAMPSSR